MTDLKFHRLPMKHSLVEWMANVGLTQWAEIINVAFSLNGFIAGGFASRVLQTIDAVAGIDEGTTTKNLKDQLEFYLHQAWRRGDIDIFFNNEANFKAFQLFLMGHAKCQRRHKEGQLLDYYVEPPGHIKDEVRPLPHNLQVILSEKKPPAEVLSSFDLANAMVGFDASSAYVVDGWFELSKTRTLHVVNWKSPINTVQRIGKWHSKHSYDKLSKTTASDLTERILELVQFVKSSEVLTNSADCYSTILRKETTKIEDDGEEVLVSANDIVKWIRPYLPSMSNEQLVMLFTLIPPQSKNTYGLTPFDILRSRMPQHVAIETFDPAEREREKQASRDADEKALIDGTMTVEEIERKNAFLTADRVIIHWDRSRPL